MMNAVRLSQELLLAVKEARESTGLQNDLRKISIGQLSEDLKEEGVRKTFWINLYNAFVQVLIREKSPDLTSQASRAGFFGESSIVIAGHALSLNEMEHGMLRHSKVWWSLGYLKKVMVNDFERKFRVRLDYRIHFALNCGATSCPAIRFYEPDKLDEQLDTAMEAFIAEHTTFDSTTHTIMLSKIFQWYSGDFGGRQGILRLLITYHVIPAGTKARIRYSQYDWNIYRLMFQ